LTSFLIIDDHPLFREAIGNAVRLAHPDARIFEAMSIKGALGILAAERGIDLALLDLSLPDAAGFSGFQRLREAYPRGFPSRSYRAMRTNTSFAKQADLMLA
jgi:DNA-binding NarL/FixJ family response regulator